MPLKSSRLTGLWEAPEVRDCQGPESSGPSVGRGKRMQGTLSFFTNVGKIHTAEESSDAGDNLTCIGTNTILNLS